jgi:hypothetical protein
MERYKRREAILIPIILKPCFWTSEEFAKLQVLPKNCRPLVEWPDSGFTQVAEELRTILVDLLYPQQPSEKTDGLHGNWIIKLRSRPDIDSNEQGQQIVKKLREYTGDYSIILQAKTSTQIVKEGKNQIDLMLIITGTPEAFSLLFQTQTDGRLASEIDEDIISLYAVNGATVLGSSILGSSLEVAEIEGEELIIKPGRKIVPQLLKGLFLPKGKSGTLDFIFDNGNIPGGKCNELEDSGKLLDYFKTCLAIEEKSLWVNLSAYEFNRMLPKELSGTLLGRNLLAQDCMLKQLTASFMHPDSPTGREYWDEVYSQARHLFGNSKIPFRSFQKVTMIPGRSVVYENDGDVFNNAESLKNEGKEHFIKKKHLFGFISESKINLKCE